MMIGLRITWNYLGLRVLLYYIYIKFEEYEYAKSDTLRPRWRSLLTTRLKSRENAPRFQFKNTCVTSRLIRPPSWPCNPIVQVSLLSWSCIYLLLIEPCLTNQLKNLLESIWELHIGRFRQVRTLQPTFALESRWSSYLITRNGVMDMSK